MTRARHLALVPAPRVTREVEEPVYVPRTLTAERVRELYPKSDPREVAAVQDTLTAQRLGICAAWYEGGRFKFALGRVVG